MENHSETFQFKTNINCSGCVSKVKPYLDSARDVCEWHVDTNHKDKILTIKSEGISRPEVIDTVRKAGFKIDALNP